MNAEYLIAILIAIVVLMIIFGGFGFVDPYLLRVICTIVLLILLAGLIYRLIIMA